MTGGSRSPTPPGHHPLPPLTGWSVHISSVPVAITAIHPSWPPEDTDALHDLSGSFAFGLRQIDQVWRSCHDGASVAGYVIELRSRRPAAAAPSALAVEQVQIAQGSAGKLLAKAVIGVECEALAVQIDADINAGRTLMAEAVRRILLGAGMPEDGVSLVAQAWHAAPPTFAVQILNTPTVRNDLPGPIRMDAALLSGTDRLVAQAVRQAGVQPATYRGDAAKILDRDVLAPAALDVLTKRLAAHSMDELVQFGMGQMQRVLAARDRLLRDIRQSVRHLVVDWDPATRYHELQAEYLHLRRCAETAIEAALRVGPTGHAPVDAVAWSEISAASNAYLSATMRSENIHHQVRPTALQVSESFEIATIPDDQAVVVRGRVYDLDSRAFGEARAAHELAEAVIEPEETESAADDGLPKGPDLVPAEVDAAMREAYGTTASDVLITLFALSSWPLQPDDEDSVTVPPQGAVQYVLDGTILGDQVDGSARVAAAVSLLTSTAEELRDADWKPWHSRTRKRRLLIQPLPTLSDGSLLIAPHVCLTSLSVYRNYLSQGQLPWSQPPPPRGLEAALERVRDARNRTLERRVAQLLRDEGWSVIDRVSENKPQRLNLPSLSTEIDAVAGRAGRSTVWLLEVKDPVDSHAVPEIRRQLDHFFVGRKSPAYATQLHRKFADLAPHADAVARALKVPASTPSEPFVVKALFVTRKPVPAAFVTSDFEFVCIADLHDRLSRG